MYIPQIQIIVLRTYSICMLSLLLATNLVAHAEYAQQNQIARKPLTRACSAISIEPTALPNGIINQAYSQALTASGGTAPYTFALTAGQLPAGITLASDGTLAGTPTVSGSFNITVTATDAESCTGSLDFSLIITCNTSNGSTVILQNGILGQAYSQTIMATGGVPPHTFAVTSGVLPTGLALSADGIISGVPSDVGLFDFTITATDTNSCSANQPYQITVTPLILTAGTVGQTYSYTLAANGGLEPYAFTVVSGSLPDGLTLNSDGTLSGTPTQTGTYNFTVSATDGAQCTGEQGCTLVINCNSITMSPSELPNGTVEQAYSATITASGGIAPYAFSVTSGALPDGLALDANGNITGNPSQTGAYNFTVTVTDNTNCTQQQAYSLGIDCNNITILPAALPSGKIGQAYSTTVSATGGITPYSFAVTSGSIPTGLTFDTNGTLSGIPTVTGTYNFTVTATDSTNCTQQQSYTAVIHCNSITIS